MCGVGTLPTGPVTPSFVEGQEVTGDNADDNTGLVHKTIGITVVGVLVTKNRTDIR